MVFEPRRGSLPAVSGPRRDRATRQALARVPAHLRRPDAVSSRADKGRPFTHARQWPAAPGASLSQSRTASSDILGRRLVLRHQCGQPFQWAFSARSTLSRKLEPELTICAAADAIAIPPRVLYSAYISSHIPAIKGRVLQVLSAFLAIKQDGFVSAERRAPLPRPCRPRGGRRRGWRDWYASPDSGGVRALSGRGPKPPG